MEQDWRPHHAPGRGTCGFRGGTEEGLGKSHPPPLPGTTPWLVDQPTEVTDGTAPDLRVMSSSPVLGMEITLKI